jgi:hypothetical protein
MTCNFKIKITPQNSLAKPIHLTNFEKINQQPNLFHALCIIINMQDFKFSRSLYLMMKNTKVVNSFDDVERNNPGDEIDG